jgi:hypothetical protein
MTSPNPAQNALRDPNTRDVDKTVSKPGLLRRFGPMGMIFLIGLLIGLIFFLSRELLWSQVLRHTLGHLPNASWSWQAVGDRGLTHITYQHFELHVNQNRFFVPQLTIQLGTTRPVTMTAVTGPTLVADLSWDKELRLSGSVDLQRLMPEQRVQGTLETAGFIRWRTWDQPPYQGELDIQAPGLLVVAPGIMTINLRGQATLEDNHLRLTPLQADGPVGVTADAEGFLDWKRLENTTYSISGTLTGLGNLPFSASGRLGSLWGR